MPTSHALPAFRAPSLALLATEPLRAILEFCSTQLGQEPMVEGDGHPVVVYPGLGFGALTTSQLRNALSNCNFAVYDWELGTNRGPQGVFTDWMTPLVNRVEALREKHGRRVSLVGWSLGGIYAREIAKRSPEAVRQVITLATPFHALDGANHAGTLFKMLGGDTSQLTPEFQKQLSQRPPVPTTSVYSKNDGVVCWEGCLEQPGKCVENIHVPASHLGMPSHPEVMRVVANRLAQPEGTWRPYGRRARLKRATPPTR